MHVRSVAHAVQVRSCVYARLRTHARSLTQGSVAHASLVVHTGSAVRDSERHQPGSGGQRAPGESDRHSLAGVVSLLFKRIGKLLSSRCVKLP